MHSTLINHTHPFWGGGWIVFMSYRVRVSGLSALNRLVIEADTSFLDHHKEKILEVVLDSMLKRSHV